MKEKKNCGNRILRIRVSSILLMAMLLNSCSLDNQEQITMTNDSRTELITTEFISVPGLSDVEEMEKGSSGTEKDIAETAGDLSVPEQNNQEKEDTVSEPEKNAVSTDINNKNMDQVHIIMAGDMLLHTRVTNSGKREDGTYNYDFIFEHTDDIISEADFAIANEEVILGGKELGLSGYPAFNGPTEFGDSLVTAGFDIILHATNHALDKGKKGLISCIDYWDSTYPDIRVIGINETKEDSTDICVISKNDVSIAILNYTYGTNGISLPEDMPYAVNILNEDRIRDDIKKAKEMADFVIVCPHWGTEYLHGVSAEQKKWTKIFLEEKVDLVIGTHPHVVEPVEWVQDVSGHKMLVFYSIGNFVNATEGEGKGVADRMLGALADVTIEKNENGQAVITDYSAIPVVSQLIDEPGGITVYPISEYTEELANQNQIILQDQNFSYAYLLQICEDVFLQEQ